MLLCDVTADDISRYQAERLEKGAAPKTVNLEVGTLRAILRKNRLWASIQPDVRMLRASENVGRAISVEEEAALLEACRGSRSRSLYPAVLIALNTCMRYSELRLPWSSTNPSARGNWSGFKLAQQISYIVVNALTVVASDVEPVEFPACTLAVISEFPVQRGRLLARRLS